MVAPQHIYRDWLKFVAKTVVKNARQNQAIFIESVIDQNLVRSIKTSTWLICEEGEIFLKRSYKSVNPLSAKPTKWSNTLKQFVGNSRRIFWVHLTILWGWRLKG